MAIPAEDVARVRAQTDIVHLISERAPLKRVGTRFVGLCPFHNEKTPSFSVNPTEGFFYCFGCGKKGDAIDFLRETEHLSFIEAVEKLAARVGITLQVEDTEGILARKQRAGLYEALEKAVAWYHERLLSSPDAAAARKYLRGERGYDGDVVRAYRLGWAPEGWDGLAKALRLPQETWKATGLGYINDGGRLTDFFRGRITFPICDHQGRPVGIGARQLDGPPPKYKNTSETPLYKKSEVLYGLDRAKQAIVNAGRVVLCEGYTDVIAFQRCGVPEAVATCGTAITEEHVKILVRFGAQKVVLGYDADNAGQNAAAKFYEWERRHGLDVRVVALPRGADPADLFRQDPDALATAVADARPFLGFRLERLWVGADLRSTEGRVRAAEQALAMVAEHPDPLVRDTYLMEVASRTSLDEERLRRIAADPGSVDVRPVAPRRRDGHRPPQAEVDALSLAVHRPGEAGLLEASLFADELARVAFAALLDAERFADAVASADPDAADLLGRLSVAEDHELEAEGVVWALVDRRVREAQAEIKRSLTRPDASMDELLPLSRATSFLQLQVELLAEAATRPEALTSLVAWLARRDREEQVDAWE